LFSIPLHWNTMAHAAAVSNGKYSFALDSFYVETSGHQVHRRATIPEIQALFHPGHQQQQQQRGADPTGHWYEAQLLHYGLPPSKTKAVAKTRLLDAVNGGKLAVPTDVLKIEADLKKEWKKKDKDLRAERAKQGESSAPDAGKKKRVRADDGIKDGQRPAAPAKKAKSSETSSKQSNKESSGPAASKPTPVKASTATTSTTDSSTRKPRTKLTARCSSRGGMHSSSRTAAVKSESVEPPKKKQTARRGGAMNTSSKPTAETTENSEPPKMKQTARCSRGAMSGSSRINAPKTETSEAPKKKQPAPRGGGALRGRQPTVSPADDVYSKPNGSRSESDIEMPNANDFGDESGSDGYSSPDPADTPRLGLINGYYEIESPSLDEWSQFPQEDFSLLLSLSGNSVWGEYDFGMFYGILHMPKRPWTASEETIPFKWRGGNRSDSEIRFGNDNKGFIRFLGEGKIEGEINCYGHAKFSGWRTSGDDTSSPRTVASLRREWAGYNEDEYDRRQAARWH
jgi:hypothetical protein